MLIKQHNRLFDLKIPKSVKIIYFWNKGLSLFANKNFKKGDKVMPIKGELVDISVATPEAVQITAKKFVDTKYLVVEDFINHSCSPNTKFDFASMWFIAIKDIHKNDEITFNYLTTEWDIKKGMEKYGGGFECLCGSKNCLKNIDGFKYLSQKQKLKLKPLLSPFLLEKLSKE